jgi:hypothetical protein
MIHPMNKKAGPPQRPGQWKIAFSCSKCFLRDTLAIFAYQFLPLFPGKVIKWGLKVKPAQRSEPPAGDLC